MLVNIKVQYNYLQVTDYCLIVFQEKKLYLTSASEKNHSKKYDINDFFGTVQNNLRKVKWIELNIFYMPKISANGIGQK